MDVNLPDVKAEVEAAFARYEAALMDNDVDALHGLTAGIHKILRHLIGLVAF